METNYNDFNDKGMSKNLKTWPERIFLTHGDPQVSPYEDMPDGQVSWSDMQIEDGDVAYVRADLADQHRATAATPAAARCGRGCGVGRLDGEEIAALVFARDELREQAPAWAAALDKVLKRYNRPTTAAAAGAPEAGEEVGTV